jgi:hypothetical protein
MVAYDHISAKKQIDRFNIVSFALVTDVLALAKLYDNPNLMLAPIGQFSVDCHS